MLKTKQPNTDNDQFSKKPLAHVSFVVPQGHCVPYEVQVNAVLIFQLLETYVV